MSRMLCGLVLLITMGCSQSPTAPTPAPVPPPTATQPGPTVINLQWNVIAASCAPVTAPAAQPAFSAATIVRQSDTAITASWPYQSGTRPVTLVANFILENNVWGLCSWDTADV